MEDHKRRRKELSPGHLWLWLGSPSLQDTSPLPLGEGHRDWDEKQAVRLWRFMITTIGSSAVQLGLVEEWRTSPAVGPPQCSLPHSAVSPTASAPGHNYATTWLLPPLSSPSLRPFASEVQNPPWGALGSYPSLQLQRGQAALDT